MSDKSTTPFEPLCGTTIEDACRKAVSMALEKDCHVRFDFNGQIIIVGPHDDPAKHAAAYVAECDRRHNEWVNSPEFKAQMAAAQAEAEKKQNDMDALLAMVPGLSILDESKWNELKDKNKDPYGSRVIEYAEHWGRLMEAKIATGEKLEDCAEPMSSLADYDGITGYMYGMAVRILATHWKHGDQLRRWHNLKVQLGHEGEKANESGGVLNPTMLAFTPKE